MYGIIKDHKCDVVLSETQTDDQLTSYHLIKNRIEPKSTILIERDREPCDIWVSTIFVNQKKLKW